MTRWRVVEAAEITARLKGASRQLAVDHRHQHQPLAPLHRRRHRPAMRSFCPPGAGGSTCSSRAWPSFLHHAGCIAIGLFALRRLWWTSRSTQSNLVWPPTSVAGSTLAVLLAVCLVCVAQRIVRPRTRANGSPTADHARDHGHHLHRHRRKPSEHGTRTRDRLQMHSCAGTS
jgi:hypothetical protein